MIVAGLATIPGREEAVRDTIQSLLPQVDLIYVCFNGFHNNEYHTEPKVISVFENYGDAGKFCRFDMAYIYFSCDDDLIYPPNYVEKTLERMKEYPGCIVSYHGRTLANTPVKSYYKDNCSTRVQCLHDYPNDEYVHCGGTGVMAFHNRIRITMEDFPLDYPNMADIHMGLYAQANKIPIVALKHEKDWIKHTTKIDLNSTIYAKHSQNDSLYTKRFNQCSKWQLFKKNSTLAV